MTCAGRSRSRSLALPVSARTRRTSSIGNVLAITPRLMWSLRRMPAGRPAGARAIAVARPRASASMPQPLLYVNGIAVSLVQPFGAVAGTHRHRMDDPARRPGGWSVRHRAGPPWEEARPTPPHSGPGEVRVPPPRSADPPGPGERDGDGEADRVDCVRIVHLLRQSLAF